MGKKGSNIAYCHKPKYLAEMKRLCRLLVIKKKTPRVGKVKKYSQAKMLLIVKMIKAERPFCEMCGDTVGLNGHHIQPKAVYPELACISTNIIILCPTCHVAQHRELILTVKGSRMVFGRDNTPSNTTGYEVGRAAPAGQTDRVDDYDLL